MGVTRRPEVQAAIDIGTNTMLMLIAEVEPAPSGSATSQRIVRTISDHIDFVRLGQGVHKSRRFAPEAMERSLACFRRYRDLCDQHGVKRIHAVGTSASRDSSNALAFYEQVREQTGIAVRVIPGKTEARLSFIGGLLPTQDPRECALLDIGGGSTEFVALDRDGKGVHGQSLDVGCVRATETYLRGDPYTKESLKALDSYLRDVWYELGPELASELREKQWVGIAGTPTTLAGLDLDLSEFIPERVDGYRMDRPKIEDWLRALAIQKQAVRAAHPLMGPGRADIMVAGTAILVTAMEFFKKGDLIVSSRGLRHGVLLDPPA